MEIDTTINISILISACLAILGWMVNNYYKREHEIAKKRLEYRLEALHSFIPVYVLIEAIARKGKTEKIEKDFYEKLNASHLKFQLYGNQHENETFKELMQAINSNNIKGVENSTRKLIDLILAEIRSELKLPKLK